MTKTIIKNKLKEKPIIMYFNEFQKYHLWHKDYGTIGMFINKNNNHIEIRRLKLGVERQK